MTLTRCPVPGRPLGLVAVILTGSLLHCLRNVPSTAEKGCL